MKSRIGPPAAVRKELHRVYGGACAFCGESAVPLEIAHIVPISAGGTHELDNLVLLCPNCHRRMDFGGPREADFVDYLSRLMKLNPLFEDVTTELTFDNGPEFGADIAGVRMSDDKTERIVVECKNYPAFSSARLEATIHSAKVYRKYIGDARFALAFPGRVSEKHREEIYANNVELWDIDFLVETFEEQIRELEHPYFQLLFLATLKRHAGELPQRLLSELKAVEPGKKQWARYQKTVAKILEHLFCPPLKSPITEHPDLVGVNRRDIILPNYADEGFWGFMRETYRADYIVIDAKNYKGAVKKDAALQVANYLKPHGAGMFGLIICRTTGNRGCMLTIREQWIANGKLILIVNDEDMESMLLAKSSGGNPEEVLSQKIEEFRLGV